MFIKVISFGASIGNGYPFRKSARPRYGLPDRFCLLGGIPNPLENPLTTYNTAQGGFDGILREILQKVFLVS